MKCTKSVIGLLVVLGGLTLVVSAQPQSMVRENWQYLGQSIVDGTRDHDSIRVSNRGAFRAIQLRVQNNAIDFQRVVVRFENGTNSEVEVRDRVPANGQTRVIDLPGDNRRIQSVEFWYGTGNWGRRRPTLRLYGLASNQIPDNQPGARWEYLGQSIVNGRSDRDTIRVTARAAFRTIQLRVQGGEIEFHRVVVRFANGTNSEVEVRDRVPTGGQTRAIDLPGDNRRIQSVEVWYGRGNWGRQRPTLRLYGRR